VPREWRNKLVSNVSMALTALVFLALMVDQLRKLIQEV
jgi:hypothetical protein